MARNRITRRRFVGDLGAAGLFTIVPRHVLGRGLRAPSDTLNVACIGVGASAKRDCEQKPQSSAQPPDFAFTSEHMSVESPNWSRRTAKARSTRASISAWSSSSPSASASSYVISGGKPLPPLGAREIEPTVSGGPDGYRLARQDRWPKNRKPAAPR
jgi:hypothetical protein